MRYWFVIIILISKWELVVAISLRSKKLQFKENTAKLKKQAFKVAFLTFKANILIYFES